MQLYKSQTVIMNHYIITLTADDSEILCENIDTKVYTRDSKISASTENNDVF